MRVRSSLVAIATCLLVAACGGSSKSTTTVATTTQATGTPAATASATGPTQTAATSSVALTTTTTTNASAPPEVPKTTTHKAQHGGEGGGGGGGGQSGASQGAHVQTNLTVAANGDISPPVVSVPSGVGVELHLTNHGSSAATVALSVPSHPSVKVAPGASGTLQTAGLKDGTYRILVNGTPRGQLMIGAQGGP